MEPKCYWREIYSKGGKTILWYEQDGELKYRHVDNPDQSDKWERYKLGLTNESIHKID
jgi:hypothetical protein